MTEEQWKDDGDETSLAESQAAATQAIKATTAPGVHREIRQKEKVAVEAVAGKRNGGAIHREKEEVPRATLGMQQLGWCLASLGQAQPDSIAAECELWFLTQVQVNRKARASVADNGWALMGQIQAFRRKACQVNKRNYFKNLVGQDYFRQWDLGGNYLYLIECLVVPYTL